jgi:hypothetical protein
MYLLEKIKAHLTEIISVDFYLLGTILFSPKEKHKIKQFRLLFQLLKNLVFLLILYN